MTTPSACRAARSGARWTQAPPILTNPRATGPAAARARAEPRHARREQALRRAVATAPTRARRCPFFLLAAYLCLGRWLQSATSRGRANARRGGGFENPAAANASLTDRDTDW